jgi:serine protease Do
MVPVEEETVVKAVEKASGSVVNINSSRLYRDQYLRVFPVQGLGSGVIIDKSGLVLTNNHVVERSDDLRISLADGRNFKGRVVAVDPETDVAVVRLENITGDLPSAEIGDSSTLKPGQLAIAIGNPFGLAGGPTVTVGVVSALNRQIQTERGVFELVQTDASINPGNSGGPLVDSSGRVIGINTAMIPFAHGIGFAIPINTAIQVAEELITKGKVIRPWIGVSTIELNPPIARQYDVSVDRGILVAAVSRLGPAYESGLKPGDVIVAVNDKPIERNNDFVKEIRSKPVGEILKLSILRNGVRAELTLRTVEAKQEWMEGRPQTPEYEENRREGSSDARSRRKWNIPVR